MLHRYGFIKDAELISIYDEQPQRKSCRERYDSVAPGHIPGICVSVDFTQDTEKPSLKLPSNIFSRISLLRDCPDTCRGMKAPVDQATGDRLDAKPVHKHIHLPGTLWDFLTLLKLVFEDSSRWNGHKLLMNEDGTSLAAALEV